MADDKKPFKKLTWKLAVLAKCRQCAITPHEVKRCTCKDCALWHFRLGKSPKDDVNALDLRVFSDDENSVIFRVRKGKDGDTEDDVIVTRKEYPAYIEDDELDEDDEDSEE